MRKTTFLLGGLVAIATLLSCSSTTSQTATDNVQPTKLDIESFINGIDTQQDISQLSLSDCRILRNGFAARVGYPFRDAYLRGIFGTTSWYDSLMYVFDEDTTLFKQDYDYDRNKSWRENYYLQIRDNVVKYNQEELDFVNRLKAREEELKKQNFDVPEGQVVNLANLVNPQQLVDFDSQLEQQLSRKGFAIVPADYQQLFHVYEKNDYANMPSFVTTDLFLQVYHLYFDCLLRDVEQKKLFPMLHEFYHELWKSNHDGSDYNWVETYIRVISCLYTASGDPYNEIADAEYNKIMKSEDDFSEFLGYTDAKFSYSLFRPRGHYTRNDTLQRYFRTMMWLQSVPLCTDKTEDMDKVVRLAEMIGNNPKLTKLYQQLTEPITWLMGRPDDVTLLQVWEVMKTYGYTDFSIFSDKANYSRILAEITQKVDEIAEKQTRIRPKFQRTGRNKVCLMPQRYQPDAEVLLNMVDYDSDEAQRAVPEGLDLFAAMGVSAAEQLLKEEGQKWKDFEPMLKKMKARMDSVDWQETIVTRWLSVLKTANETSDHAPYFMLTPDWDKKQLNSSLSSWAELKHDAILYAKQPMGAECGGAGPPDPVVKGYVEPNTGFWRKAIDLLTATSDLLYRYEMMTEKAKVSTDRLKELAQFLLAVSKKELEGKVLMDEEYDQLEHIGATIENISLDLIREPDQWLMGWDDVQGTDRNVALVADVYTANADNNPDKCILYAGIGQADEIYVIVEIGGYLYLMRGAVFSYREFTRPMGGQRLTDEEWQQYLKNHPREGVPQWMKEITVPLKKNPEPNEKFFYSTGC